MEGSDSDERPGSRTPPIKGPLAARIAPIRSWFHSRPGGPALFRALIAVTGVVLVAVGLLLVPLPGPGWLIVLAGITVWAIEFAWARHLLRFTTGQLRRWNDWQRDQHWLVRVAVLLSLAALTLAALWLSVKHGLRVMSIKGTFSGRVGVGPVE
ncbi:TIGR02611 family protein [Planosporangium thailandense]|uniref:TIGR02611 family protein n=1 Tax=Planosporangium thailandense TaxID=765197 RepID=A0ABX0Y2T7_9ACTN|nr:TIGR02611 family protein [Planosporangium thailandense]NJC72692.1 TIGR02611 family protein [Planosporangium thailandense]